MIEEHIAEVATAFESCQTLTLAEAFDLWPDLKRAFTVRRLRAAFVVLIEAVLGNRYKILFVVPGTYPRVPPAAYCLSRIKGQYIPQHRYSNDGRICYNLTRKRDWDPKCCRLVTAVGWAAVWLFCQEYLQRYSRRPAWVGKPEPVLRRTHPWSPRTR